MPAAGEPPEGEGVLHAVIMAGGSGTRFWPESRRLRPKQLLSLFGRRSMIQETVARLEGLAAVEQVTIATSAALADAVRKQLPGIPESNLLAEPCKRDTAPCIGLAAFACRRRDPDAVMAVMPSDHVIADGEAFCNGTPVGRRTRSALRRAASSRSASSRPTRRKDSATSNGETGSTWSPRMPESPTPTA